MGYYVMNCLAIEEVYNLVPRDEELPMMAAMLEAAIEEWLEAQEIRWTGHEDNLMRSLTGPHEGGKGSIYTAGAVFNYTHYDDVAKNLSAITGRDVYWMGEFDGNGFRATHYRSGREMTIEDY